MFVVDEFRLARTDLEGEEDEVATHTDFLENRSLFTEKMREINHEYWYEMQDTRQKKK